MGSNLKFLLLKPSGRNTPLTRGTSFALYLYVINQVVMKNPFFSGLIFCGALFVTAQTNGQSFANNGDVIIVSPADHSGLIAYTELNNIILQWSTGNERNVDRYIIEHATDSIHFNTLHEIVSRGTIGQEDQDSLYRDMDSYPASPVNYYRLRTVLSDGNSLYSAIVRADVDSRKTPTLKPTVLHMGGTLRMDNYHEQPLTVNFFNANGTLMGSFMVNSTSFDIPTNGWSTGIIFYRISDATHPLIDAGKIMIL